MAPRRIPRREVAGGQVGSHGLRNDLQRVEYTADPEALEYNQSLSMTDEDSEFIEAVYSAIEGEGNV